MSKFLLRYVILWPAVLGTLFTAMLTVALAEETTQVEKPFSAEAWVLGPFSITPEFSLLTAYDNNIYATRDNEVSDRLLILVPSIAIKTFGTAYKLELNSGAAVTRYDDNSSEDTEDYWLNASGRYELSPQSKLFGGANISQEHEDRDSPDDAAGTEPTSYLSSGFHLGTEITRDRFSYKFGGTYQQLDFDDVSTQTSKINNDDRDRSLYGLGLRTSYQLNERHAPFIQLIYDQRRYDHEPDDAGYKRDSDGYRAAVGLKSELGNLTTEFTLGGLWQDYSDSRFTTVRDLDIGATINWKPNPSTSIKATLERSVNETTLAGASSYLETAGQLQLIQQLGYQLSFNGQLRYAVDDYQGTDRQDNNLDAGFGFKYDLSPQLSLATDYQFSQRNSNTSPLGEVDGNDYYRHQFFVTLAAKLHPVKPSPLAGFKSLLSSEESAALTPEGSYVGASIGQGGLSMESHEVRVDGSSDAELGNQGAAMTGFAGYGIALNRWYLGVEVELDTSGTDISHQKDKSTSRSFSINRDESYAASARLGYSLPNGALLYSRLGLAWSEFDISYAINASPENALHDDRTEQGVRYGVGIEFPLSEQLYGRLESTYTDYDSFTARSSDFNDHLNPSETQVNLGISWLFGPQKRSTQVISTEQYQGFYSGVMVGYGSLSSDISGQHQDGGSNPGTYNYHSQLGNHGFNSGLFAGYGVMLERFYLGAEVDATISDTDWQRIRETSGGGRRFGVEKKESYGLSARLGYLLDNGTLPYLRAGVVRAKFNTEYVKGSNPANHIDKNDYLDGPKVGVGVEVPMTASSFIRVEYSYTDFEKLRLLTAHNLADDITFDSEESLFWVGFGFRF